MALENEKLCEENAQLRELLALAGPARSAAPSAAAGLWGAGGGNLQPKAAVAALRSENLMRCRVAQLERQVCRAEAELQVLPCTYVQDTFTFLSKAVSGITWRCLCHCLPACLPVCRVR